MFQAGNGDKFGKVYFGINGLAPGEKYVVLFANERNSDDAFELIGKGTTKADSQLVQDLRLARCVVHAVHVSNMH